MPNIVYSDNAKTFRSSNKELRELWDVVNSKTVKGKVADWRVEWRYNAPHAPWQKPKRMMPRNAPVKVLSNWFKLLLAIRSVKLIFGPHVVEVSPGVNEADLGTCKALFFGSVRLLAMPPKRPPLEPVYEDDPPVAEDLLRQMTALCALLSQRLPTTPSPSKIFLRTWRLTRQPWEQPTKPSCAGYYPLHWPRARSRTPRDQRSRAPGHDARQPSYGATPCNRPTCHVATWTVLRGDTSVSFVSRRRWRDQARPLLGDPVAQVSEPFQGLTLQDRHPTEPPAIYSPEERSRLCPLCGVPQVSPEAHRAGTLHLTRAQQQASAATPMLGLQDLEAALALVRRYQPHLLTGTPVWVRPQDERILDLPDFPDI
ncbi:uncharacterized protein LOC135373053 [Ornithodoros turicata]|uniref:uncharacterized protein LOC135373053 n=1 Tax=Ornithodoros turicata TaxID=34597 RepID=UPI0031399C1F